MPPILAPTHFAEALALRDELAHLPVGVRAILAAVASLLLAITSGPRCIAWLRARYREPIKTASAEIAKLHASKRNTPTMGGVFIVAGLVLVLLVLGDVTNPLLPIVMVAALALCLLGAADDWIKMRTERRGLSAGTKLALQATIALIAASLIHSVHLRADDSTKLLLPLVGSLDMGWWFVPWAALVIVGSSNAVNLTDGLDGLAGGCLVWAGGALTLVSLAAWNEQLAAYFGLPFMAGAGEMAVVAAAMTGSLLAFLWFNCHPASVFMGDAGSLPLGGLLGLIAIVTRQELLLVVIGGVFVVEALSVILQVTYFRWTRRRLFRCAPLHHHFQLRGWSEDKIVVRFWIASGMCAVLGLVLLVPATEKVAQAAHSISEAKTPQAHDLSRSVGQEPPTFAELF